MNKLALDLQEATSDLLEVPAAWEATRIHAGSGPSPAEDAPKATYSASSRLTLLESDDDGDGEAGNQKHSKSQVRQKKKKKEAIRLSVDTPTDSDLQAVQGDVEAVDPNGTADQFASLKVDRFGSLSSLTPSIRTSSTFGRSRDPSETRPCPSPSLSSAKSDLLRRAAATAASTGPTGRNKRAMLPEVWLNERGERVVDGQVVGRLSVAARDQALSTSASASASTGGEYDDGVQTPRPPSAAETFATLPLPSSTSLDQFDGRGDDAKRLFDHMHGSQSRNSTPSFFAQSFPDAIPGTSTAASAQCVDGAPIVFSPTRSEQATSSTAHGSAADVGKDEQGRRSPLKPSHAAPPMFCNLSGSSRPAQARVTGATSDPVRLHGNRRARERAMQVEELTSMPAMTPDDTPRPSDDGERRSDGAPVDDDTLESIEGDSASSLLSLTASSVTGSHTGGDGSSQRASLRRTTSSGSAGSSSRSRPGHARRPSHSKSSGEVFARDVRIRGWSEVGGRARGYVIFDVAVLTTKGVTIRVHRRFSSFVALRADLTREAPQHRLALPALPPRDALHKFSAKHLERRRIALSDWLQAVVLDARWGGRTATREWLVGSE